MYPLIFESLGQFTFMKDLHLIPVFFFFFTNWKKSEGDFHFYEKRRKVKRVFSVCFAVSHSRGSASQQQEWHRQAPSLGTTLSISATSRHSFELCLWTSVLYLNLFCASVTKMYPKMIASLLYTILAYERFPRNALLSDSSGKPVYVNWNIVHAQQR